MYSRILLGSDNLKLDAIDYQIEYLYEISPYLCVIQFENISAYSYEEAKIKAGYCTTPYMYYDDHSKRIVYIKEGQIINLSSEHFSKIISFDGINVVTYKEFLLRLERMATTIGLKELPFKPMTASVRNAPF